MGLVGPLEVLVILIIFGIFGSAVFGLFFLFTRYLTIKRICPDCGLAMHTNLSKCPSCGRNFPAQG
jgi:hypothetical protein